MHGVLGIIKRGKGRSAKNIKKEPDVHYNIPMRWKAVKCPEYHRVYKLRIQNATEMKTTCTACINWNVTMAMEEV